jgi:hypothetical protein
MMKHSQQQHSNHHQRQHTDCKKGFTKAMPPGRKQCTSVIDARSRILSFHPRERPISQSNAFGKVIVR